MATKVKDSYDSTEMYVQSAMTSFENMLRSYLRADMRTFNLARQNVMTFTDPDFLDDMRELYKREQK